MNFGSTVKKLRQENNMTQQELADLLGLSSRTIISYEKGDSHPKDRSIYKKLGEIFNVDVNYLLLEGDPFVLRAEKEYGFQGKKEAEELIEKAQALFAGGELGEEDKDEVMRALQDAYWDGKKEA